VVAIVDDLIVLTRGARKNETEHYANQDLKKIERWIIDNKIKFKDKNSKGLFISRKKLRQGS